MKKVLIVIQLIRRGGVELVAINFAKNLDLSKFDVSFLLINPNEHQDEELAKELSEQGYTINSIPKSENSYIKKYRYILNFLKENHFDVVHSHVMFFSALVLRAAKKAGVAVRVAHSHAIKWNSEENFAYKVYKNIMRVILNKYSTVKIGCCKAAGEFLFGKKAYEKNGMFVANGISTEKFEYSESHRLEIRDEFKIKSDELLVGHIGTIYRIKNQTYLVEIFFEILKLYPSARLIMVGEMVDTEPVEEKAKALGVYDRIIFTGQRSDISNFYSALDIMVFPSLHEALPVSLIEAQASKLPCLISDTVTTEVKFNENVDFMPLSSSAKDWAKRAGELLNIDRKSVSTDKLISSYDISVVSKQLEKIYLGR